MYHTVSMSPITQFPTTTEVSRYLPTSSSICYNINDYLPSRTQKPTLKQMMPAFQLNIKPSSNKVYDEKIKTLESRISQLTNFKSNKLSTQTQNTQTDISSFEKPKKLGWGERIQVTLVPQTRTYHNMFVQTDIQPEGSKPPVQIPDVPIPICVSSPILIPKIEIPLPAGCVNSATSRNIIQKSDRFEKMMFTDRNKENRNPQRNNSKIILKDDSVELYPVKNNQVMDIVRMMLTTQ